MNKADNRLPWVAVAWHACVIAAILGYLVWCGRPPAIDAGSTEFSVDRALTDLRSIAAEPHPLGSAAHAKVRDYLFERLRALGLEVRMQRAAAGSPERTFGYVDNVIGTLRGTQPGKALLLVAHYDSVPAGPGAADDGASVAAILETLRLLRAQPLRDDVICLFSDGEEAGMLGAQAFVASDPDAQRVGLALNFEYRGNAGPFVMFETSAGNAGLVDAWAQARDARGSSLLYEIYKQMPNGTDFGVFKRAGIAGLNFAAAEHAVSYHAARDDIESLDRATLLHEGALMLDLARRFGNAPLDGAHDADDVFFDVPGVGVLHYPTTWVLPLTGVAAAGCAIALLLAWRRGEVRLGRILAAFAAYFIAAMIAAGVCAAVWTLMLHVDPSLGTQYTGLYRADTALAAFALLAVGVGALLLRCVARAWHVLELAFGMLLSVLALLLATASLAPGASYLLLWPALFASVALSLPRAAAGSRVRSLCVAAADLATLLVALVLLLPLVRFAYIGIGPSAAPVVALCVAALVAASGLALAGLHRSAALPLATIGTAAVLCATIALTGHTPQQPAPDELAYFQDSDKPEGAWISGDAALDEWQSRVMGGVAQNRVEPDLFGTASSPVWIAPTTKLVVPGPQATVVSDDTDGAARHVRLRIASLRDAQRLSVTLRGATVLGARIDSVPQAVSPLDEWSVDLYAIPAAGVALDLDVVPGTAFELLLLDSSYGLPPGTPSRPPERTPELSRFGDMVTAVTRREFGKTGPGRVALE